MYQVLLKHTYALLACKLTSRWVGAKKKKDNGRKKVGVGKEGRMDKYLAEPIA